MQLAERAEGEPAFRRYTRMAQGWTALAQEQDWLDGEVPPISETSLKEASLSEAILDVARSH